MQQHSTTHPTGRTYTNTALTAIGVLLGVIALSLSGVPRSADAQVGVVGTRPQEAATDGLISAAEQRKGIHVELRMLNEKMDRLLAAMDKGMNVRVTSMPGNVGAEKAAEPAPTPAK
jgi:hypothetical protein